MDRSTRRRILRTVAPVAGLVAAGLMVWQGSSAAFNATTTNSGDAWSAGALVLANNGTGGAIFATTTSTGLFGETALKPGSTGLKCLTVQASGTAPGTIKYWIGSLTGSTPLGAQLQLTITAAPLASSATVAPDCLTPATNVVAFPTTGQTTIASNAALTSLPTSYATATNSVSVALGTQRIAYQFSWTFVSTGSTTTDNPLQGTSVSTPFTFEEQ
jgi:hypothetical protein